MINTKSQHIGYNPQKSQHTSRRPPPAHQPGDLVLDPFCGSGTTLEAAKQLGRRFIGIDEKSDAVRISNQRISQPSMCNWITP